MDEADVSRCLAESGAAIPELACADAAHVTIVSGGISNRLFSVEGPAVRVLVRFYGSDGDCVLSDRRAEEALVQAVGSHGFGARVLRVFPGGRVEEFLGGRRPLAPQEALCRAPLDAAALVANRLGSLHALQLDIPTCTSCEAQLARWVGALPAVDGGGGNVPLDELRRALDSMTASRPGPRTDSERGAADILLGRALCHLDLFAGNLLVTLDELDIQFIDWEYAAVAPVGLDIANHFSGRTERIEGASVHFDVSLYPNDEMQLFFLQTYFVARGLQTLQDEAARFALRLLLALAAEAELRWVVWGLLQRTLSPVDFDYDDYAAQRWANYNHYSRLLRSGRTTMGAASPAEKALGC